MKSKRGLAATLLLGASALATAAYAQEAPPPPPPPAEDATAAAEGDEVQEIVVRGVNIPDEKRATSEIASLIDEESFQRTGDSDIAEALGRVTGISLNQGRFVIVRGLNERYSAVTINGSPLPSPEPLRRVVPLDIIPTAVLSGSLIQKTFSPQFSGEFGGGLVELRTKSVPEETFLNFGGSIGLLLNTSGQGGLVHDGGDRDWTGFDDGTRNTPPELAATFAGGAIPTAQQDIVDASVNAFETALISESTIAPDWSINTAFGTNYFLTDTINIGGTIALGYSNSWQTRDGRREQGFTTSAATRNTESEDFDFISTENVIDSNAVATLGAQIGDNTEITWTSFLLRSTIKDSRISEGVDGDAADILFNRSNTEFFERQVWQSQLRGDHVFPAFNDASIAWRAAYGEAFRDAPFQRSVTYIRDLANDQDPFRFDSGGLVGSTPHTIGFSKINDENIDAGFDIVLPLNLFSDQETQIKFGYSYGDKSRTTFARNYEYVSRVAPPSSILTSRVDQLFAPSVTSTALFDLSFLQSAIDLDNSDSDLTVHGAYFQLDAPVGYFVRVAAGVRYEDGKQVTRAFQTTAPSSSFSRAEIDETYLLPAVTVTWNPIEDVQVRGGFSQTITRPQFRELTPAFFLDDETDLLFRGNPFLVNSEINNFDIRGEYYFGRGRFITLGGFYKDIQNPIEEQFARDLGGLPVISYINAPSAQLYGFEFEFENTFPMEDLFGEWAFATAKDFVVRVNYTFSDSSVSADGTVTTALISGASGAQPNVIPATSAFEDGRALQGQSKHLGNLQLGWESEETDSRATILFNYASSRIRNVELVLGPGVVVPRVIEQPPITVDFVWSRGLQGWGGAWELGFEVRNILGEDYDATQTFPDGSVAQFDTYGLGREISFNIKKEF